MKASDRYLKIVEWSEEDGCYVGTCPGLMLGGVHGDDEARVYAELCQTVEEWIAIHEQDGAPLPPATARGTTPASSSSASAKSFIVKTGGPCLA
jgi:predicted RNase H-like HicB family nuclease